MPKPIQRGPASWQVKIRRKLPDGKISNINRTFETYSEAQRFIDGLNGRIAGHEDVGREREKTTSLQAVLRRYLLEVTPKKAGHVQEVSRINIMMRQPWSEWPVVSVNAETIAQWRNDMLADDYAPSTINNFMNTLSAVYKLAITEWGYKVANPVQGLKRIPKKDGREAYLTAEDEVKLLAACENGPAYLPWCVRIAITTAMRASEIRRLQWRYVDVGGRTVHLPRTKNGTKRNVPLVLNGAAEVFEEAKKILFSRDGGYIFGDPDKRASEGGLTQVALSAAFSDAAARAKLPDLTFHDLRHVAITRLAPLHRDVLDLAKTTGHKSLGVLLRYYNEAPGDRSARLRKIAEAMTSPETDLPPNVTRLRAH